MGDQAFTKAFTRIRGRYTSATWQNLSAREITDLIYREMHLLDQQFVSAGEQAVVEPMRLAAE
jgi:hypothetical protein